MITRANWPAFSGIDSSNAVAAFNRLLPPWVNLLLVILIGWQVARIVWMLVPGTSAGDLVQAPPPLSAVTSSSGMETDADAIATTHLFGIADEAPVEAAPTPVENDNLADTGLTNLVLKGTIASVIPEYSVAVIADGKEEQKVYIIGDAVGAGAKLHAVYPDRVVLNENGALTNLRLPVDFPEGQRAPVRRATRTTRQVADASANPDSIQNVVTENLTRLTDVIRPTPYLVNGEQTGYRVYPGRNRRQFAALGLRPGDLIMDIDGQSLTDPTQAMQIFQSLGDSEEVTVTVERNGQQETLVLRTSQLALDEEETE